ncbi:hypothetical protein FACS1894122_12170 [Alphaproteobacteria bacterium]|nr:hypothetical protein FACS1894122_12170 [Alphaproteobacteria bacterium]
MDFEMPKPLEANELEELCGILASVPSAMNLETVDGFFAMLHCRPDAPLPSTFFSIVWGGEKAFPSLVSDVDKFKRFMALLTNHWNGMLGRLEKGIFKPVLISKLSDGTFSGNDWAKGFVCGMLLRESKEIDAMIHDCEQSLAFKPIFALMTENTKIAKMLDFDGEISSEERKELIDDLSDCVPFIYKTLRTNGSKKKKAKTRKLKTTT